MASTDDSGAPDALRCEHCGAPMEPGHITCQGCGEARSLGGLVEQAAVPALGPVEAIAGPSPEPAVARTADEDPFGLGDPFRDVIRRKARGPAQRSRTTLLVGGLVGLILVVLVAAAALWALGQNGATTGF